MKTKYLNRIKLLFPLKTINVLNGLYKSIYHNNNLEIKSLREYIINDDIKHIDWKSSAKKQHLLIKEYEPENNHNIIIVLDIGKRFTADTDKNENKKELLINIASTISYISLNNKDKISLLFNNQFQNYTNNQILIDNFISKYDTSDINQNDLSTSINYIKNNIKKKSIIYIITDLKGIDNLNKSELNYLSKNHTSLLININDSYLYGNNIYNIDSNKYIPKFIRKDKNIHQEELKIRKELLQQNIIKLRNHKINMTTISNTNEIINKLLNLLKEYNRWKNFK